MMQTSFYFDGNSYEPKHDKKRLTSQFKRVRDVMLDGQWHTLAELEERCGGNAASVSARLRDMRKIRFGGYAVDRKRVYKGVFAYRVR